MYIYISWFIWFAEIQAETAHRMSKLAVELPPSPKFAKKNAVIWSPTWKRESSELVTFCAVGGTLSCFWLNVNVEALH